jgi:cytidylate kinase
VRTAGRLAGDLVGIGLPGLHVPAFGTPYRTRVIVTISSEYGSGALAVSRSAAAELGYEYVDSALPVVVGKRLSVPPEVVEANEDTARTFGERWLNSLERATPELAEASTAEPFDEEVLRAVQDAVREYAARGNVVIVGRASGVVLGARPDVLRVFIYAPRQWRIDHLVQTLRADPKIAQEEVERIDRARAAYLRDWYGVAFGDPHNHDLCIDASRFGDAAAHLIVQAVRARTP